MVKQLEWFDFQYALICFCDDRSSFRQSKPLPFIKQPKCKHCKYSVSRIKPDSGVAQPSLIT